MQEKNVKNILIKTTGIVCFILLSVLLLVVAARVTKKKNSQEKYAYFFKDAKQIDVLYLGSSHVINAVNPAQIFKEYGYTGYNMGGHGSLMNATYHTLLNALDYCSPKVVFIDVYMMEKETGKLDLREANAADDELNVAVEQLHLNMDVFPLTRNKAASIRDLIEDPETQWEFLLPFSVYHNRWKEHVAADWPRLDEQDTRNLLFGAEERFQVFTGTENYAKVPEEEGFDSAGGEAYLQMALQLCEDNDIAAVLMFLPFYPTEDDQRTEHTARLIAEAYGVPYLDFCSDALMEQTGVDLRADLNDHGHLNLTGMEKVSAYLGAYLEAHAEEYGLEDHRGEDPAYTDYQSLSDAWEESMLFALDRAPDDAAKLNILYRNQTPCAVYLRSDAWKLQDSGFTYLVDRLAGKSGKVYEAAQKRQSYLLISDPLLKKPVEILDGEETEGIQTSCGELAFFGSGHYHNLYMNGDPSANLLDMEDGFTDEVQIVVLTDPI